ncbi:hypothetical protein AB0O76_19970 [Streptomyces sp. NPDC086554]|uniref:hypothetical protein n=1 Tax=Streptomyces sp. NPDC086554 TaxID=3154864 RepID=UPI00343D1DB5
MESVVSAAASGVTLASGRGEFLLELVVRLVLLRFLPFWQQLTIYGLVLAAVVVTWIVKRSRAGAAPGERVAEPET